MLIVCSKCRKTDRQTKTVDSIDTAIYKFFTSNVTKCNKIHKAFIIIHYQAGTKCCSMVAPLRGTECKKEAQRGRGERKR